MMVWTLAESRAAPAMPVIILIRRISSTDNFWDLEVLCGLKTDGVHAQTGAVLMRPSDVAAVVILEARLLSDVVSGRFLGG